MKAILKDDKKDIKNEIESLKAEITQKNNDLAEIENKFKSLHEDNINELKHENNLIRDKHSKLIIENENLKSS